MTLADRIAVMSTGDLQQFGSPLEVYHRPKNRFVAGFMGSPAMNFVDGAVEADGDGLVFKGGGVTTRLVPAHAAAVRAAGVSSVTLGLRPQQLHAAAPGENVIARGQVAHVEMMGAETFAHVRVEQQIIVVRLPGEMRVTVGDELALAVEEGHVHVFDGQGVNITVNADVNGQQEAS
ncbi:MAG: TOBE domain-containing protein, partial [Myxococcales bacterium]|nr:TOBE domain-containing protein [Myxococcales bacterium]